MSDELDPIGELVRLLSRLPGVGERTAARLAYHVLAGDRGYAVALGESIGKIHERVRKCDCCGNFCAGPLCRVCGDPRRQSGVLCVVARVPDLAAIEKSGSFRGRYHVLHGLLAPLDGVGPDDLPLDALEARIARESITEVVVATPLSVEGEATALYVAQVLKGKDVRVTRIASGIPHGGELEFADQVTVGRAFEGRRSIS
ncbi:MAG: recombination protein RecR [Sandaracinaceae bacterium]|nr:recombination protein RecR [Sandaracinaceae bacterium]